MPCVYALVASVLLPAFAVEVTQHDGTVVKREANPQAVGCDQRQDRPQEHSLEQIVQRTE